ncbi:MAG: hypothetical protein C0418_02065 [Coriobacteriaceae bacterium]|nr:hypothetical protein [Coriobacteriaceae bacterium]
MTAPPVALRETCRVVRGTVRLWGYHRERLEAGGCPPDVLDAIQGAVLAAAAAYDAAPGTRVRLTVTLQPDRTFEVDVERRLSSLDVPNGPLVARIDVDAPPTLPPGAAKPADRAYWDEAQRAASALGAHQAVLIGADGLVIDGGTATVWAVEEGVLVTPPAPPAVAGVARAALLDAGVAAGLHARVEQLSWERYEAADEALLTNAFGGAVAVRGRGGPVTDAVREMFSALWHAQ